MMEIYFKKFIRRITYVTLFLLSGCVGQKEDYEPAPKLETGVVSETGDSFFRRVLVTEFTATWCVYCPDMKDALGKLTLSTEGRIVEMAVHSLDDMSCEEGESLTQSMDITAWPTAVFNLDPLLKTGSSSEIILSSLAQDAMRLDRETCGIKVSSSLSGSVLEATVVVKTKAGGDYTVVTAIVEDEISGFQAGRGNSYIHNNVLRDVLSSNECALEPGGEHMVLIDSELDSALLGKTLKMVVYVLNEPSHTVNNVVCTKIGDNGEYEYEKN